MYVWGGATPFPCVLSGDYDAVKVLAVNERFGAFVTADGRAFVWGQVPTGSTAAGTKVVACFFVRRCVCMCVYVCETGQLHLSF